MSSFDGRVAIITGAGSAQGIGFACAQLLVQQGARVVITSTTERIRDRQRELGSASTCIVADLTQYRDVARVVDHCIETFGRLDILINNAGMTSLSNHGDGEQGSVLDITIRGWKDGFSRNVDTAFVVSKTCLPYLLQQERSRMVMVSSMTGPFSAMRDQAVYAASKASLVGLCRSIAVDFAGRGLTCNTVAPGWISTASQTYAENLEGDCTPIGRSGTPTEVAHVICSLVSPHASFITGQCIAVDGGNGIVEERLVRYVSIKSDSRL